MKVCEQEKAIELRHNGRSIKQIAKELKVAASSVSRWVRDVEISEDGKLKLEQNNKRNVLNFVQRRISSARKIRQGHQQKGIEILKTCDSDFVAGCMLYWGEGSKSSNSMNFSNSDANMVVFFKGFLDKYFSPNDNDYRIQLNFFTDVHSKIEIENYWLKTLNLPVSCLTKSIINQYSKASLKKRNRKLEYGTCRLSIHRMAVVQQIFGAIQEYAGFTNLKWLN
jgi:hypothetical protein